MSFHTKCFIPWLHPRLYNLIIQTTMNDHTQIVISSHTCYSYVSGLFSFQASNHHLQHSFSSKLKLLSTQPSFKFLPFSTAIPFLLRSLHHHLDTFPQSDSYIMAITSSLKAVTLTHVRYERGDQLGHFLAWVSLIPIFISLGGFVSHFLFRRELQGLFFALGLSISQFINEIVKDFFQQSRPETCIILEMCDSHGWPSSHSQYMFFFAVYFTLLTYKGIGLSSGLQKWIVGSIPWSLAVLTMYSRVYLGYHTVAQVFAGAALGIFLGGLWFQVVNCLLVCYFPAIEESAIGRMFYIKDSSHIDNVLKFEYDNARAARKNLEGKCAKD